MKDNVTVDWREVWERKGRAEAGGYDLETLLKLDGFDSGAGEMSTATYRSLAQLARRELALRPGMRLLDVGCGAGAMLSCFRDAGLQLLGVDYSSSLIEHARRAVPEAELAVAEAVELPFEGDVVVCLSVFQYFPDLDYARRVLAEFQRVAPVAFVMDVPDLATREESELARASAGSRPSEHLYYPRSFFGSARLYEHSATDYGNAPFRFHALLDFRN